MFMFLSEVKIPENCNNTLILDRDGVINRLRINDYVKKWEEFEFLPTVLEALAKWSQDFRHIIIVTNQRGVGRNLMTEASLLDIHQKMIGMIKNHGGRIDKVYYCTALSDDDPNRKPNIGMALQAKTDFPGIDFKRSVMIGDQMTDMIFAKRISAKGILIQPNGINYF